MRTSVVTSVDTLAFRDALEHRHALIEEIEGTDWDQRHPGWRERYERFYRESFGRQAAALISCEVSSEHVGSCVASLQHEFRSVVVGSGIGYVNGLYVIPEYRGGRVGSTLVRAAIEWLIGRGCPLVRLHPSGNSTSFYERLGFRPIQEYEYGKGGA